MTFMYISNINSILKINFARYTNQKNTPNKKRGLCVILIHILYESDNLNYIFFFFGISLGVVFFTFIYIVFHFMKSLNLFTLNYTKLQITKLGTGRDPINRSSAVDSTVSIWAIIYYYSQLREEFRWDRLKFQIETNNNYFIFNKSENNSRKRFETMRVPSAECRVENYPNENLRNPNDQWNIVKM